MSIGVLRVRLQPCLIGRGLDDGGLGLVQFLLRRLLLILRVGQRFRRRRYRITALAKRLLGLRAAGLGLLHVVRPLLL